LLERLGRNVIGEHGSRSRKATFGGFPGFPFGLFFRGAVLLLFIFA
jgi:hypothetical protein